MLYKDGIHDDTQAIQELLDNCGRIILDAGTYLISKPLIIHSNTQLLLAPNAVMKLADGANCAIILNDAFPGTDGKYNENITISGGIWDGNNVNQVRRTVAERFALTHFEIDFYYGIFMRFIGIKNLKISDLTIKDPESYAMQICAAEHFTVDNIRFDYNLLRPNMDGVHVDGPARFGTISNIKGTTNDDLVALNCDDGYACEAMGGGNIEDISIHDLYAENGYTAVRLLSCGSKLRNVSIRNVFGSYRYNVVSFTHHNTHPGRPIWFDNVLLDGIFATKSHEDGSDHSHPLIRFENGIKAGTIIIKNLLRTEPKTTDAPTIFLGGTTAVETLILQDIHESIPEKEEAIVLDTACVNRLLADKVIYDI